MDDDKRNTIRVRKRVAVDYSYDDRKWIASSLYDISEQGLCITTDHESFKDENILIHVQVAKDSARFAELPGKVITSIKISDGAYLTHIEFLNLTEKQLKNLRIFVAETLVKGG